MVEIIPAIMPESVEDIRKKLTDIMGMASTIQLDLMDGNFVKGITWPYNHSDDDWYEKILAEEEGLPFWDRFNYEFDLMINNAKEQFDVFTRLGASRVVFHMEAENDTKEFKDFLEGIDLYVRENVQIGLAVGLKTNIEEVFAMTPYVDFIQCMGIDPVGLQGAPFKEEVLGRIETLKSRFPDLSISVDGGVNLLTAPKLIASGADRLIVGSAIWKSNNIIETMDHFKSLTS